MMTNFQHEDSLYVLTLALTDLARRLEAGGRVHRALVAAVEDVANAVARVASDMLVEDARERLTVEPVHVEPGTPCIH